MAEVRLVRTPAAEQDLIDIWATIALDNRAAADRVYDQFLQRAIVLTDFPELGPSRPEISEDIRTLTCGRYLILYRILPDAIEIARIVHGARDLTTLF
jgi:toxin ParE1/3/4